MATMRRVYLYTLGCPKNDADSSSLVRRLGAGGVAMARSPEEASHILINTCGFTQDAKEESIGAILDAAEAYPEASLVVMGCLVERYRAELEAQIPEVAAWFGLGDQGSLVRSLTEAGTRAPGVAGPAGAGRSFAYIKISDGCDHPCTFCAIPGIKGPYRGRGIDAILEDAAAALDEGARELVLVGQDTAIWAEDGLRLPALVERLAEDPRLRWIRLLYLQPEHVDDELLHLVSGHPKVAPYLDIPFQHASGRVLRRMGRKGDGAEFLELLARARALMSAVSLRSTFIVGFPGETEDDFEELLHFVSKARFAHAGAFVYSAEEGTTAARLRPLVPERVARERLGRLSALLMDVAEQANAEQVGRRVEVMVDAIVTPDGGPSSGARDAEDAETLAGMDAVGRTRGQAPEVDGVTFLEGPFPGPAPGDVVEAVVTDVMGYDLIARRDGP